jgi:hypothetical protein
VIETKKVCLLSKTQVRRKEAIYFRHGVETSPTFISYLCTQCGINKAQELREGYDESREGWEEKTLALLNAY